MNRRSFLTLAGVGIVTMSVGKVYAGENETILAEILRKAQANQWKRLEFGDLMGKVGLEFVGTPYEGGTLEGSGREVCRVTLDGLDCVTYFESVMAIAWMIKNDQSTMTDLRDRVAYTRYRGGKLNGYVSRLHYTADWIYDNVEKGTVLAVTPEKCSVATQFDLNFMSTHPKYYGPLKKNPELTRQMAKVEESINAREYDVIPQESIRECESALRTGDIIAVTTSKKGLDYSHTGMILVKDGVAHFMHASSSHKKVLVDASVSEYVKSVKAHTGISVVRPTGH